MEKYFDKNQFISEFKKLRKEMFENYNRHVSLQDLFSDRWETAKFYNFGEGSSCYNNVLILGDVSVGKNVRLGAGCIIESRVKVGKNQIVSSGTVVHESLEGLFREYNGEDNWKLNQKKLF